MERIISVHHSGCDAVIWCLLRLAVAIDAHRRRVSRGLLRLRGSVRRAVRRWWGTRSQVTEPGAFRRRAWNRTPPALEERLVHLHVALPGLGAGHLARLAQRVLGFSTTRETVRRILLRRKELVVELEEARRRRPRRITVERPLSLWGVDATLVWVLGFFPVWILGAVDYHGSRVVAFERLLWPTSAGVVRVLEEAFARHGTPARLLSDNGSIFTSAVTESFLSAQGVSHSRIRPGHCWTNGRIERVFRTFKETAFGYIWLFASVAQVDRFCADFVTWHNRDRPHSAWAARTPDEVFFGRRKQLRPLGRVAYFDGHLEWWRFG